eukprot:TRINITY_DN1936_c0_g1_i2.p1 TRINITY_DN1936_c0_g1~~TRINITY_DN1936_c0_g1_i2.p1  ORF type:complete len:390 (+),score=89.98 TRINITY_DN1936_c0_g1_i2:36-1205(+)
MGISPAKHKKVSRKEKESPSSLRDGKDHKDNKDKDNKDKDTNPSLVQLKLQEKSSSSISSRLKSLQFDSPPQEFVVSQLKLWKLYHNLKSSESNCLAKLEPNIFDLIVNYSTFEIDNVINDEPIEDYFELDSDIRNFCRVGINKYSQQKFNIKTVMDKRHLMDNEDGKNLSEQTIIRDDLKMIKTLHHPNLLRLYDVFEDDHNFYLIEEYVSNAMTISDKIIEDGSFSEELAKVIMRQIFSSLSYIHKHGTLHGDLKPENVYLFEGSAQDKRTLKIKLKLPYLQDVSFLGSAGYIAPEVLITESVHIAADVWSAGVTTYILLSGSPPFCAETTTALFRKIKEVQYTFDDPCWKAISDAGKDFIRKLLVKDSSERLTSEQCLENAWLSSK